MAKTSFDVIINATSVGMGTNKQSPLEEKELNTKYLFDLVYVPAETNLVKMARAKNIQSHSGAGDVRAAGRSPVRNLGWKAGAGG